VDVDVGSMIEFQDCRMDSRLLSKRTLMRGSRDFIVPDGILVMVRATSGDVDDDDGGQDGHVLRRDDSEMILISMKMEN
jgi:hypothetical protein